MFWFAISHHLNQRSVFVPEGHSEVEVDDSHLTYAGLGARDRHYVTYSSINVATAELNIDVMVTLFGVDLMQRDEGLRVASIAWLPYHFLALRPVDAYSLTAFSAIASLAPTSAAAIRSQLDSSANVVSVPHIIEVPARDGSCAADATAETCLSPYAELRARLAGGDGGFSFVALMAGGNYEAFDRKGWAVGVAAFARLREQHANAHLFMHAPSSREIASPEHPSGGRKRDPPWLVTEKGLDLIELCELNGLPEGSYTLVEQIVSPELTAAFRRDADVCLHPSKTEGFGMNVLECQAAGVPVITTKFLAMDDYTFNGISVPYRQTEYLTHSRGSGVVATPDVLGIAAALEATYVDVELASRSPEAARRRLLAAENAIERIRSDFSRDAVGDAFAALLRSSRRRPEFDERRYVVVNATRAPVCDWHDTPFTLILPPGVELSRSYVEHLTQKVLDENMDLIVVTGLFDYQEARDESEIGIIVRTGIYAAAQQEIGPHRAIICAILVSRTNPAKITALRVDPRAATMLTKRLA